MINFENKNIKAMLLNEEKNPFDSEKHLFEIKYDGIRAICYASKNEVTITNRYASVMNGYPELSNISNLVNNEAIFDGEIIMMDEGKPSFEKLQERSHLKNITKITRLSQESPVTYVAFDILYENGKDLTTLPLKERKKILNKYKDTSYFTKAKFFHKKGTEVFKSIKELGLEGIVAKETGSKYYVGKRTNYWIKIKNEQQSTFTIFGYIDNKNTISLLLGEYKDRMLFFIGKVSVHKKYGIKEKLKKLKIINNPFINYLAKYAIFCTPKYKCTVKFTERTKNGHIRHPAFIKFE